MHLLTERGRLIALAVAVGLVLGMAGPTSAQFFNFGGYQQRPQPQRGGGWFGNEQRGGGWFGNDTFAPYQQHAPQPRWHGRQAPPAVREDFSKAPPPEKRNTVPERHILVLGDAMADWLAYGLEDVYADQPEMGVIRKHKTVSGLIKYQPKGDPADWAAAAKGILATEKADAIVVMLGLDDRVAIREPAADKSDNKPGDKKDAKAKPDGKPSSEKPAAKPDGATKAADPELSPDDAADNNDARPVIGPEKSARSPNGLHEFREKRWVELYTRKDRRDDRRAQVQGRAGAVGRSAGGTRPQGDRRHGCFWIRSIAMRPARPASPMSMSGTDLSMKPAAFCSKAPISKGRSASCAPPTACTSPRPARSSSRIMSSAKSTGCWLRVPRRLRCRPNRQRPTPMRGPVSRRRVRWPDRSFRWWPLLSAPINCSAVPGRGRSRSMRRPRGLLVKGEPLPAPAGRADDFAWPRREIGREGAKGETPVASTSLDANARAPAASLKPKKHRR